MGVRAQQLQDIKPCAKDPTYQFLEAIQKDAYESSPEALENLKKAQKRELDALEEELMKQSTRPNALGLPPSIDAETMKGFEYAVSQVNLPTCYEDPGVYFMIQGNVKEVERARRELGIKLAYQPKYGSLPTTEVNAYTFLDSDTKERVIAFNTELFRFAYVETALAVATIPVEKLENPESVSAATPVELITEFFVHPEWRDTSLAAILSFLHVPSRIPIHLDLSYDRLAIPFVAGMDVFVTAHEYGHIIRKDKPWIRLREIPSGTGAAHTNAKVPVASWTWHQELKADQIGIQLAAQVFKNTARDNEDMRAQWLYALRGALLFMECLEIIEDSKFIQSTGNVPSTPTDQQKKYIRQFADGRLTSERTAALSGITPGEYPPSWLRSERIAQTIAQIAKQRSVSAEARKNDRLAHAIVTNMAVFWAMSETDLQESLRHSVKK